MVSRDDVVSEWNPNGMTICCALESDYTLFSDNAGSNTSQVFKATFCVKNLMIPLN